jgi:hypothetical protein
MALFVLCGLDPNEKLLISELDTAIIYFKVVDGHYLKSAVMDESVCYQ